MMVCPEYRPLKYDFFPYEAYSKMSLNSFYNLMKTEDENKIRHMSKFLYNAFKIRKCKNK